MKKKFAILSILLILAATLTSCVKLDVDLKVKRNGKIDAAVLLATSESVSDFGVGLDEMGFSGEDLKEMQKNGWQIEAYNRDGFIGYRITQSDVGINQIMKVVSQVDGESADVLTKKGTTYTLDIPVSGILGGGAESELAEMASMLRSFGASMKFRITLPDKPLRHNATTVSEDGKTLGWDLLSMETGESIHVEFKAGGGFLKYALIMSCLTLAVAAAVILIARGKRNHTAPAVPPDVFPDELNGQGPDDPENEI